MINYVNRLRIGHQSKMTKNQIATSIDEQN